MVCECLPRKHLDQFSSGPHSEDLKELNFRLNFIGLHSVQKKTVLKSLPDLLNSHTSMH